jgi:hypothetical protein
MTPKNKNIVINKRVVGNRDTIGRKYLYHSQKIERSNKSNDQRLADLTDERVKNRKLPWLRNLPTIIAFIAVILTVIYIATLNDTPKIYIENSSNNLQFLHTRAQYQQSIKILLDQSVLNKSKFTIDTNKLETEFESEYPELDSATIIIPISGHSLELMLKSSIPEINIQNSTGYFLLNDNGVATLKFSTQKQMIATGLPTLTDQSNSPIIPGKEFLSHESMSFIEDIIYQYSKKSISIQSISLPNIPYELDVQSRGDRYYVKYNLLNNSDYQIGSYLVVRNNILSNKIAGPNQYIDVRVNGKVYLK